MATRALGAGSDCRPSIAPDGVEGPPLTSPRLRGHGESSVTARAYIARETAISVVINAVLSIGALFAIFGPDASFSLQAPDHLAADFLPQGAIIALMSTLIPGLLTSHRVRKGEIPATGVSGWPRPLGYRLVAAVGVGLLISGGAIAAALVLGPDSITLSAAVAMKAVFGALVALIVTPLGLRAALARPLVAPAYYHKNTGVI